MSSGTRSNPSAAYRDVMNAPSKEWTEGSKMGLSPRQMQLDRYWRFYRCTNYDSRIVDWNGDTVPTELEAEVIYSAGYIPAGFYDGGQRLPLKYRRPLTPYRMTKVVVDRFTSLLFSKRRHPNIVVEEDPATEEWLLQFVEETRLWSRMIQARKFGGAMGSVGLGFKFVDGRPIIEVHDPRWCTPTFVDRHSTEVRMLEKRYMFAEDVYNHEKKEWQHEWFWYRRVIDTAYDCVWSKVPVDNGEEPNWDAFACRKVHHSFGFCPVVWIHNSPVEDDVDGDPDCHGIYDTIESIDTLLSQSVRGTVANCDPTLVMAADADFEGELEKGSDNSITMPAGGNAQYLEISGAGPKMGVEMARTLREYALEVVRCVLDTNVGGPARTALEIERNYANMIEQADVLREQYGELGVKRLLEMVLEVVHGFEQTITTMRPDGIPEILSRSVQLRHKVVVDEETGERRLEPLQIGKGHHIDLQWGDYFEPGLEDVQKAVQAAGQAKQFQLIDLEKAVQFIADYFGVEDVRGLVEKLKAETPPEPAFTMFPQR